MGDGSREMDWRAGSRSRGFEGSEQPRRGFANTFQRPSDAASGQGAQFIRRIYTATAFTRAWSTPVRIAMGLLLIVGAVIARLAARDLLDVAPNLPVLIALVIGAIAFGRAAATIISAVWVLLLAFRFFGTEALAAPGAAEALLLLLSLALAIAIGWLIASLAWALDNLERSEAELQASHDRLVGILDALPIGVSLREMAPGAGPVVNAAASRILRGAGPQAGGPSGMGAWESYDRQGRRTPGEAYPAARVFTTGEPAQGEFRFRRGDGTLAWVRVISAPLRDRSGRMVAVVTALVDIDRKMRLIEHQGWLVAELAHRTRNLMAVVQGLATATLARATDLDVFRTIFLGRLQALAAAHSLFLKAEEKGVELRELMGEVLAPFGGTARLSMEGPEVRIASRQGVALALVLHEMATNAAKYGALSRPEGALRVAWTIHAPLDGVVEPPLLHLSWAETGLGAAPQMAREGFGLKLIRRSAENDLDGTLERQVEDDGFTCVLRFPLLPDRLLLPEPEPEPDLARRQ